MFYYIGRFILGIYIHIFYRLRVTGAENIPNIGGFVLCSNHLDVRDPMALSNSVKRKVHFIGKQELFENKFFSFVLHALEAIAIDRENTDMATFKSIISILKEGEGIGIFAQGSRIKEIDAKGAKSGVALFALKAEVPIIPVCISGSYKHFSKLYVNIGKPIPLDEYKGIRVKTEGLNKITETVMQTISDLKIEE